MKSTSRYKSSRGRLLQRIGPAQFDYTVRKTMSDPAAAVLFSCKN